MTNQYGIFQEANPDTPYRSVGGKATRSTPALEKEQKKRPASEQNQVEGTSGGGTPIDTNDD